MLQRAQLAYFLFVSSINLTLAFVVYFRNRCALVNRLFAASVFWVVLWTISNLLLHAFAGTTNGLFWGKVTFAMASLIPPSFLAFAKAFPSDANFRRDRIVLTFGVVGVAFFGVSFTDLIVTHTSIERQGLTLSYGLLYPVFAFYFLICFATAFQILWRKYNTTRGIERLRLRYLFLGTFLAVTGAVTTNLVIPLVLKTSRFSIFGPAFTVFVFGFVAHAILRHRLMDIRVVIRRGASYFISLLVSGLVLFTSSALAYLTLNEQLPTNTFLIVVFTGMLVALAFRPLFHASLGLINRYVHRPSYDQNATLQETARILSSSLEKNALLTSIAHILRRTVRPESFAIYLSDEGVFKEARNNNQLPENPDLPRQPDISHLVKRLREHREALLKDEVIAESPNEEGKALLKQMTDLGWDVVLPIWNDKDLTGFIALGPKLSGDPFFTPELQLLSTVANQAGMVLANARLYEEVKNVKDRIEGILRNMESGVVAAASSGAISAVNAVAEGVLGIRASDLSGKPLDSLPYALSSPLRRALETGETCFQTEAEFVDARGRHVSVVLSTSLVKGIKDDILQAILVFTDNSKIKELEAAKRRAERLAAFQAMTRAIAHEIKNPLVAIKTFAELLPERFADEDFRGDFLKVVVQEIERIDDLVARLRGLAIPQVLELRSLDLREPIEETLVLLRGQLEQSRVLVTLTCEDPIPLIEGDKAQLKQLFLNLFINAIEAMGSGGELMIRLSREGPLAAETVLVEVSDSGTGIPESVLMNMFDPFVTTKRQGSGLGLSISRGIADAHNASIYARNNPSGRGATIFLELPAPSAVSAQPRNT